jgi:hypothetical protein
MRRPFLIALGVTALAGCTTVPRLQAAGDIHAFLVAVRDGDRDRFEAHIDRSALKSQLRARFIAETARSHGDQSWQAAGAALVAPLVDIGVDTYVRPDVFRAEAIRLGYTPDKPIPNQLQIAAALRPLDADRVCVVTRKGGPCTFVFRNEAGTWRLVAYEGPVKGLKGL